MSDMLFLYRFVFARGANPPTRKSDFDESLKTLAHDSGLVCHMSALGGGTHTMGTIHREDRDVTDEDRTAIADWVKGQPVRLTASFGPIERDHEELELFREVDDMQFSVDNLSESDFQEARSHQERIQQLMKQSAAKNGLPGPKSK